MFFVIDKAKLQRMLAIVRDDRTRGTQGGRGPFMRIEAAGKRLKLDGRMASVEFPATVHEPGVLFVRVTMFRRLLGNITIKELGTRHLAFQVNEDGLRFDNVRIGFSVGDMLLYPDPSTAPEQHPEQRLERRSAEIDEASGTLWEGLSDQTTCDPPEE